MQNITNTNSSYVKGIIYISSTINDIENDIFSINSTQLTKIELFNQLQNTCDDSFIIKTFESNNINSTLSTIYNLFDHYKCGQSMFKLPFTDILSIVKNTVNYSNDITNLVQKFTPNFSLLHNTTELDYICNELDEATKHL